MTSLRARRLPRDQGPAAWSTILPDQAPPVPLPGDLSVDVAIVGGGFAGLAATQRQMQTGHAIPQDFFALDRDGGGWTASPPADGSGPAG
jgi:hypothetical protein